MSGGIFPWGVLVLAILGVAMVMTMSPSAGGGSERKDHGSSSNDRKDLPEPRRDGAVSLERAIEERRSTQSFSEEAISLAHVGQILWAAQGITDEARGYRAAPSAGATYPLNTYLVAGNVEGLSAGFYRYIPGEHALASVGGEDIRAELQRAALGQESVGTAAASLVLTCIYARTTGRYRQRGVRYTHMEAGHAAQNAYLQATALKLGMVAIGAFEDGRVKSLLNLESDEEPLYLLPFGRPADS